MAASGMVPPRQGENILLPETRGNAPGYLI